MNTKTSIRQNEVRESIRTATKHNHTSKIPNLALKPGTGTTLVTAVPLNLPSPQENPRNPIKMCAEEVAFLCLLTHPAILTAWQAAVLFGFKEDDIRYLVGIGELPALAHRTGCTIRIALVHVHELRNSVDRLAALCEANRERWEDKNLRRHQPQD